MRWVEVVAVFGVVPVALTLGFDRVPVIPSLLVGGGLCLIALLADSRFDRSRLWRGGALRQALPGILGRWLAGAVILLILVWWLAPEALFNFPRQAPQRWMLVMLLYPLLSAWPQELIFRAFFLHRYARLLGPAALVVSALAFAWAHVLFRNWPAVVLSFPAGLMFAWTYRRHRSLACSTLEHALWGDLVFTVGLGRFFYNGA